MANQYAENETLMLKSISMCMFVALSIEATLTGLLCPSQRVLW